MLPGLWGQHSFIYSPTPLTPPRPSCCVSGAAGSLGIYLCFTWPLKGSSDVYFLYLEFCGLVGIVKTICFLFESLFVKKGKIYEAHAVSLSGWTSPSWSHPGNISHGFVATLLILWGWEQFRRRGSCTAAAVWKRELLAAIYTAHFR